MNRADTVQALVIGRMAARYYADLERLLRVAGWDEKADIARRAAMAEFENPAPSKNPSWCGCLTCQAIKAASDG